MEVLLGALPIALPVLIGLIFILIIFKQGYLKAPPDQAFIISGMGKPRILTGKAGLKVPFFERVDKLDLGAIQIDVKTSSAVPTAEYINIKVDSYVNVRVGTDPEMLSLAAQNFLNVDRQEIGNKVRDLLEGNIREIVGQMKLTEMVSDRKRFSEKVQENAVPDLARFGLELVSFNVQNFIDDNNVINDLGIDNVEQIRKSAAIAKSTAKREIAEAEAENARQANEAKAKAETDIAQQNAQVAIAKSELKAKTDVEQAKADAAYKIQEQEQARDINTAKVNADIAKREREVELRAKEIELRERELDATVRKQAEAEKYAEAQKAEADLIRRQKDAEAKAYEVEQQAKAARAKADADKYLAQQQAEAQKAKADADKYSEEQRAAGIAAVGVAEAEAIEKKAEAQKKMGEASVIELVLKAMPEITAAAAAPLNNVDSITMYGDGNGAKVVGDVMKSVNQVTEALKSQGIDLNAILGGFFGAKAGTDS